MPEYLSPGVYLEERQTGPEPIESVSTSTTGFVGMTQRGPFDQLPPILVTSFPEFARIFGGYFNPAFTGVAPAVPLNVLPYAVAGFFNNGGKRLYIKRVANGTAGSTPASAKVAGLQNGVSAQIVTRLAAPAGTGSTTLQLQSLRGIQANSTLSLTQVLNGVTTTIAVPLTGYNDSNNSVTFAAALAQSFDPQFTTVTVTANAGYNVAATPIALSAADPGAWGNSLQVKIRANSRAVSAVASLGDSVPGTHDMVILRSTAGFYVGAIIEFNLGTTKSYAKVTNVNGNRIQVTPAFGALTALNPTGIPATIARTCEFDVLATDGTVAEAFRGLTLDDTTPYFYATTIVGNSLLLTVPKNAAPPPLYPRDNATADPSTIPMAGDGLNVQMNGGADGGVPTAQDYIGADGGPGHRTGIAALMDVDQISIIGAPGYTDPNVQEALITQCETLKYRFAILDPAPTATNGPPGIPAIQAQRGQFDTKYAAIYYPRVIVYDPLTDSDIPVPPSGHMAGIYAATDDNRGVWKAPANVVIQGIVRLETKLSKGDHDILNPEPMNICALRDFTAQERGLRVYGARCITSDAEWKYINIRRLFILLEASLDQGTQWAVFEPNDERLWARLIQSVSSFLTTIWREGGLMGSKAEEAFFVKCGYETMTQDDIENGRLIMEVGVAPVFPAEFVIIRIGQWAGGSSVQEV
ncbi:MAG: hypothetical protein C5B50_17410 [Verrucomicrobia bacterium]|nr:MAG: hypothetical protein C5B50_17410 [Verrucomicrobiota bacterium]